MQKVFKNGTKHDNREILIIIDSDHIEFFHNENYEYQLNWLKEQEDNWNFENLSDDQKANNGFYWIFVDDWKEDRTMRLDREDNWHRHIRTKNWFTEEMYDFIENNIN